MDHNLLLVVVN